MWNNWLTMWEEKFDLNLTAYIKTNFRYSKGYKENIGTSWSVFSVRTVFFFKIKNTEKTVRGIHIHQCLCINKMFEILCVEISILKI